jgi:glyoxylase-like metal-dependent hydrolase (beta-lactamase superfamily II)
MGDTACVTADLHAIDTLQLGRERAICCWRIGDLLIDPGPASRLPTVLQALDGLEPRAVLLTHIHLDHAAATGALARMYPDLQVYVHELGAPHMLNPERLIASATRLYGDRMDTLWGKFEPVPEDRLHVLVGGETLEFDGVGAFEVAYTPGHAKHHVSYMHEEGSAFVGDVAGVRIAPGAPVVPPTPPPDIDLDLWHQSIETVAAWEPVRLCFTHFGSSDAVQSQLAELGARLDRWADLARDQTLEDWREAVIGELRWGATTKEAFETYTQATPFDQSYAGLRRYWDKRNERMLSADVTDA